MEKEVKTMPKNEVETEQVELIRNADMYKYVESVQRCKISEVTAIFIACIRVLNDLYGLVHNGLVIAYGGDKTAENVADKIIQEKYGSLSGDMDSVIREFMHSSIYDNTMQYEIDEI